MAVSEGDLAFALDQLAGVGDVRHRRLFSGVGFYCGERFFALLYRGVLYLKVDDQTRARYTRRHLEPFTPRPGRPSMSYYPVPAAVLEDADQLREWALEAVAAADRAVATKARPRRRPGQQSARR